MKASNTLGGQFRFPGTSLTVQRIGYGAMQLAGPGVSGPPKDPDAAVAHLRENLAAGQLRLSPQTVAELEGIVAATGMTNLLG